MTEIPTPKEVASELVKMWPHVQECTICYNIFASFPSFCLAPYYLETISCWSHIQGNVKRLIPSILESADWHCVCYTMNVPNWFWKLLNMDHRKWQCLYHRHPDTCTRAMQGTRESVTATKYPLGLHIVHGQCFKCGMWCSIQEWLHCSMVLQKSTTRIWINPAASLEYLS